MILAIVVVACATAIQWAKPSMVGATGESSTSISEPSTSPSALSSRSPEDVELKPGQQWIYRTRPGEEASRLVITKLENLHNQSLVHISLSNVSLDERTEGLEGISHLPFSESGLRPSLLKLDGWATLPREDSGYDTWRRDFDAEKAGVFETPVADVLNIFSENIRASNYSKE